MPTPTIIGGNTLSPFYSTALFVPWSGATGFTAFASQTGGFQFPFTRAIPHRKRGLADVTHSWFPLSRGRRQTQVDWDALLNVFLNPDVPPEAEFNIANSVAGYQMYLTMGTLANYPAVDTNLEYWWVPSVFVEEIPHTIDLTRDPPEPIAYDLRIRSNGPAFFLPTDGGGGGPISQFVTYCAGLTPAPWSW